MKQIIKEVSDHDSRKKVFFFSRTHKKFERLYIKIKIGFTKESEAQDVHKSICILRVNNNYKEVNYYMP